MKPSFSRKAKRNKEKEKQVRKQFIDANITVNNGDSGNDRPLRRDRRNGGGRGGRGNDRSRGRGGRGGREAADKASSLTMQMNFQHWDNLCHLGFLIQKIYSLYVCCIQRTQRIVFRLEEYTHKIYQKKDSYARSQSLVY